MSQPNETEVQRQEKANKLASIFLDDGRGQQEKLIAALGIMSLRYQPDGSLPDVLTQEISAEGSKPTVKLENVKDFLLSYYPTFLRDTKEQPVVESFNNSVATLANKLNKQTRIF